MPKAASGAATPPPPERRPYDNRLRRQKMAETRERILIAASELVHGFTSWDWRELTFRAVAEQAGIGERTVYRHFPTERQLHDAVMRRLEEEAGIAYEEVNLDNLSDVTARIFASLSGFAVADSTRVRDDPTFGAVSQRRQMALRRAVGESAPNWTAGQRDVAAGLLDTLWNLPTYERLITYWEFDHDRAVNAIGWLIDQVLRQIGLDAPPPA